MKKDNVATATGLLLLKKITIINRGGGANIECASDQAPKLLVKFYCCSVMASVPFVRQPGPQRWSTARLPAVVLLSKVSLQSEAAIQGRQAMQN